MSHAKATSRNLHSTCHFLSANVLLSVLAMCVAAPLRQQREVFTDVTLVTTSPTGTDCSQVTAAYIKFRGTQEEKAIYAQLSQSYQENGRLSFEDLKSVYAPTCKTGSHETDKFKEIQCFSSEHLWPGEVTKYFCWCADPTTGHPISGNVTEGTEPMTECAPLHSCSVSGNKTIPNGEEVEMEGNCQICTCYNGTMNCRKTLSSGEGENFTLYDLHLLKVQLLKRLYIQKYHGKTSRDNISREMMQVSDQRAIESSPRTLEWKWRNMPKTWQGVLTPRAVKEYAWREVSKLTCFFQLVNKFSKILDADGVNGINQTEFIDFFNLSKNEEHLQRIKSHIGPDVYDTSGEDPSG